MAWSRFAFWLSCCAFLKRLCEMFAWVAVGGMSNPWGPTAESAVRWSFGMLARTESTVNILGEMRSGTKNRSEMDSIEFRGQAALIRREVEQLTNTAAACHIIACSLPRPGRERLAGGRLGIVDRMKPYREAAVREVALWLVGHPLVGGSVSGLVETVRQYALGRGSVRRIARAMRAKYSDAIGARTRVYGVLDDLYEDGLATVERRLQAKNLI